MNFIKKYAVYFLCLTLLALLVSFSHFNQSAPNPNDDPDTGLTESIPSSQATEPQEPLPTTLPISEKFADKTDKELIEAILTSRALEYWKLLPTGPESENGINWLRQNCPEFAALMLRDTYLTSLNTEAPSLVEEQLKSEDGHDRLKAHAMICLCGYLNKSQNGGAIPEWLQPHFIS